MVPHFTQSLKIASEAPTSPIPFWAHHSAPPATASRLVFNILYMFPPQGLCMCRFRSFSQMSAWLTLTLSLSLFLELYLNTQLHISRAVCLKLRASLLHQALSFTWTLAFFFHSMHHDLMFCMLDFFVYYSQSSLPLFHASLSPPEWKQPEGTDFCLFSSVLCLFYWDDCLTHNKCLVNFLKWTNERISDWMNYWATTMGQVWC